MPSSRLIIVQPWFTARGHPAQSLINTARVLGRREDISYLISWDTQRPELSPIKEQLRTFGEVSEFEVQHSSLAAGTAAGLWKAVRLARQMPGKVSVFFLDAHIPIIAALWPVLRAMGRNIRLISLLGLSGPEPYAARWSTRFVVRRFLSLESTRLFLRTEELASAWQHAFDVEDRQRVATLPSLEIPETDGRAPDISPGGRMQFGILGQVRRGKGLEWLVPLFQAHPEIGELRITGTFYNSTQRQQLAFLQSYPLFKEEFVPDHELVARACAFDYLLILYDDWDSRLEAATLYLAARARRPVVCYDTGWCGRMATAFQCGVAVPPNLRPTPEFFSSLPPRGSEAYRRLVLGMERFHAAHSGEARRSEFLSKLVNEDVLSCGWHESGIET